MRLTLTAAAVLVAATPLSAQLPQTFTNLQYFARDIPSSELTQRMREFSFALGVRCQYCHAGGDGQSFAGVDFAADTRPAKVKARAMLRMMDELNHKTLAALPSRAEPRVVVECVTCHRGLALPRSLQTTLFEVVTKDGAAAAVAKYRELRANETLAGRWNFGEWEINELARRLTESDHTAAAMTMLEMNGEFYPKSAAIDLQIAELHRQRGEREQALTRYRAALQKDSSIGLARRRIEELEKKPQ